MGYMFDADHKGWEMDLLWHLDIDVDEVNKCFRKGWELVDACNSFLEKYGFGTMGFKWYVEEVKKEFEHQCGSGCRYGRTMFDNMLIACYDATAKSFNYDEVCQTLSIFMDEDADTFPFMDENHEYILGTPEEVFEGQLIKYLNKLTVAALGDEIDYSEDIRIGLKYGMITPEDVHDCICDEGKAAEIFRRVLPYKPDLSIQNYIHCCTAVEGIRFREGVNGDIAATGKKICDKLVENSKTFVSGIANVKAAVEQKWDDEVEIKYEWDAVYGMFDDTPYDDVLCAMQRDIETAMQDVGVYDDIAVMGYEGEFEEFANSAPNVAYDYKFTIRTSEPMTPEKVADLIWSCGERDCDQSEFAIALRFVSNDSLEHSVTPLYGEDNWFEFNCKFKDNGDILEKHGKFGLSKILESSLGNNGIEKVTVTAKKAKIEEISKNAVKAADIER